MGAVDPLNNVRSKMFSLPFIFYYFFVIFRDLNWVSTITATSAADIPSGAKKWVPRIP